MAAGEEHQETPPENTQASNAQDTPDPNQLTVVGIGASAGGIRALQTFFQAMPSNPGIVFVVSSWMWTPRSSTSWRPPTATCNCLPARRA